MPTDTDPNLPSVDSPTAATPAYRTPPAAVPHEPTRELADQPGPLEDPDPPVDPATLTTAEWLHFMNCDCGDVDNTAEHDGWDFHTLAAAWEARAVADAIRAGVVTVGRAPVETKVAAGSAANLASGVGLVLAQLLFAKLDLLPSLLGGESPWVGAVVLVLSAVLPTVISFWKMYYAPHSPRVTP